LFPLVVLLIKDSIVLAFCITLLTFYSLAIKIKEKNLISTIFREKEKGIPLVLQLSVS
jgi:hypothetical protein